MSSLRRKAVFSVAASILIASAAAPAFATTEYPSGGIWNYGTNSDRVWSDYFHGGNCHSSSVQGAWFDTDSASAGQWSEAEADQRRFRVDHSYYKSYC